MIGLYLMLVSRLGIKNWPPQLIKQLSCQYNLVLYNYKGVYPCAPYPEHYNPNTIPDLSFPTLYTNLLQLINTVMTKGTKPYLLDWNIWELSLFIIVLHKLNHIQNIFLKVQ